jgi:glutathione synthase/RimK-type ligase-like ATP-grasp enzyme
VLARKPLLPVAHAVSAALPTRLRPLRQEVGSRYRKRLLNKRIPPMPTEAIVQLEDASDVLLLCSRSGRQFDWQAYVHELAFARELTARSRPFAVTDDPSLVFQKSVVWSLPNQMISPTLWNQSRQVCDFLIGLETQGNTLFCSSDETRYWENKAYMHRKLDEMKIPVPSTTIVDRDNWRALDFSVEPVLLKEEHSAGSAGIHYFSSASEAQQFVGRYRFRPTERLIMQEVVPGATRDLRLTMVGDVMIESASYWRVKSSESLSNSRWTTTATTYDSNVVHDKIPEAVPVIAADYMRRLGIRTAGIDLMWPDDDLSNVPLVLELSPHYQPNPPKPERYEHWTYKQYKALPFVVDGYCSGQYSVFRSIAAQILDLGLF